MGFNRTYQAEKTKAWETKRSQNHHAGAQKREGVKKITLKHMKKVKQRKSHRKRTNKMLLGAAAREGTPKKRRKDTNVGEKRRKMEGMCR